MNSNIITPIENNNSEQFSVKPKSNDNSKKNDGFAGTLSFAINLSSNTASPKNTRNSTAEPVSASINMKSGSIDSANSVINLKTSVAKLQNTVSAKDSQNADSLAIKSQTGKNSMNTSNASLSDDTKQILRDIKDVFKDALGVSDDELNDAMSKLGMSLQDLLNPGKLANLLLNLTGNADSDISVVLTDSSFNDIFSKLNEISDAIMSLPADLTINISDDANGIDISEMLTDASATNLKELQELVNNGQDSKAGIEKIAIDLSGFQNDADAASANGISSGAQETNEPSNIIDSSEAVSEAVSDESALNAFSDADENTDGSSDDSASGKSNDSLFENTVIKPETINTASNQTSQTSFQNVENQAVTQFRTLSNIDAADLINQIVSHARTTISDTVKSMEMELNPQSLGKMIMKVSEQAGTVSAHITVQNEDVKEALSNQMALLKTNLEAQGMKVDEVTVTADSHAFERNLEEGQETNTNFAENQQNQNGSAEENAYEENKRKGVGSLNLNNMSGSDLQNLSEEELLQAQIMKDNGNQLNVEA